VVCCNAVPKKWGGGDMILLPQFTPYTQSRIYDYIEILFWPPEEAERHIIAKDNFAGEVEL
jgi:hypothetical protein